MTPGRFQVQSHIHAPLHSTHEQWRFSLHVVTCHKSIWHNMTISTKHMNRKRLIMTFTSDGTLQELPASTQWSASQQERQVSKCSECIRQVSDYLQHELHQPTKLRIFVQQMPTPPTVSGTEAIWIRLRFVVLDKNPNLRVKVEVCKNPYTAKPAKHITSNCFTRKYPQTIKPFRI